MSTHTKFYGNESLRQNLRQMQARGRMAHGILLHGAAGLGKKTLAAQLIAGMLCQAEHAPCGNCRICRMLEKQQHPDVRWVEHSGKLGGFSVETVRSVCADLAIPPSEGDAKFYVFADCDAMDPRTQNLLLKAVEEPPDYVYFLFTAESPAVLLPTVRSRIVSEAVFPVTEAECREALGERGFSPEACEDAVSVFHGNIGRCLAYLEEDAMRETVTLTKTAINSIIKKDEYTMLQTAAALGKDRSRAVQFLLLLDRTIRDAMVRKHQPDAPCIGCDAEGASLLARQLSSSGAQDMHLAVNRAYAALAANVNLPLALSALCAACMDAGTASSLRSQKKGRKLL